MSSFRLAALSTLTLAGLAAAAPPDVATDAKAIALPLAPPVAKRVAMADLVVVGKVTGFADKLESATAFPGAKDKTDYQVAVVQVDESLQGGKGLKEVRVGFLPSAPGVGTRPPIRRFPTFRLEPGQEVVLFLVKHHEGNFQIGQAYYDVIVKAGNANFDKDVAEAKRAAALLADPKAGLESKDAADRLLTAELLISRYRTARQSATPAKQEAIDADESKLILKTLAEADWNAKPAVPQLTPQMAFGQLAVGPKDGWTPPADGTKYAEAARQWLKDNADKYRIQRFVREEKKDDK
jgi:hypothetical protein